MPFLESDIDEEDTITYLNDLEIKIPHNFRYNQYKGIKKFCYNTKGELNKIIQLSYRPVLIQSILVNPRTGDEKVEILLVDSNQSIIIEKSDLYSKNKILKLADKGIQVTSNNAKEWIDYFSEMEALNRENLSIKKTVSNLGWIDNVTFIPYVPKDYILDVNSSVESWIEHLKPSGDIYEWLKAIKKLRIQNSIFRFILSASFAAPLLKITDTRPFIIYNWATSKGGKTATAYCAMSVWGNPENLKVSFDATANGIEGLSKIFSDFPILIDEKQMDNNQNKIEETIYMFANGKSKLRATKTGEIQRNYTWRAIALTTGEEPLSSKKTNDGVRTRVLELYGRPINDERIASSMYGITQKNYGLVGKIFIEKIIKLFGDTNYKEVNELNERVKETIKEKYKYISFAQLSYIGLVTTADILIGKIFFNEDKELSYKMAEEIIKNINNGDISDVTENAKLAIIDWILSNLHRFDERQIVRTNDSYDDAEEFFKNEGKRNMEKWGLKENGIFYIFPTKFEEYLKSMGYNSEKIKQNFMERKYILSEKGLPYVNIPYKQEIRQFIGFKLIVGSKLNADKLRKINESIIEKTNVSPYENVNLKKLLGCEVE